MQKRKRLYMVGILVSILMLYLSWPSNPTNNKQNEITLPSVSANPSSTKEDSFEPDLLNREFTYGDINYIPINRFSLKDVFIGAEAADFIVAQNQLTNTLSCFLTKDNNILYEFPESYFGGVRMNLDSAENTEYEGAFFQDVNGDGQKDIVLITYGAVGNFPQVVNLVTVFLQGEGFSPDDSISESSIAGLVKRTGQSGKVCYITIEDVCRYYENQYAD